MPTTRRPLQRLCIHLADLSPCQKQAPRCVWVASTIVAPSGVCFPGERAPRCMVQQTDSPRTTVFVARQLVQRFIVESIGTLLEGSGRGVQERHVQLNSQHEISRGVYCRSVRGSATHDCRDSTGGGGEVDSQGQQVCFESNPSEADVTSASKATKQLTQ